MLLFPSRRAPERDETGLGGGRNSTSGLFRGVKVLIVEDDFIVAFDMQALLEEEGAHVLGPATSMQEARSIIASETPQAAILDVNLNGEFVFPLAEELRQRGVPFVFATAYADDDRLFPAAIKSVPRLAKPVLPGVLISQLKKLL